MSSDARRVAIAGCAQRKLMIAGAIGASETKTQSPLASASTEPIAAPPSNRVIRAPAGPSAGNDLVSFWIDADRVETQLSLTLGARAPPGLITSPGRDGPTATAFIDAIERPAARDSDGDAGVSSTGCGSRWLSREPVYDGR